MLCFWFHSLPPSSKWFYILTVWLVCRVVPNYISGVVSSVSYPENITLWFLFQSDAATDSGSKWSLMIIIIMEICKASTLRLKALNKHTHIMYIEMENVIPPQMYMSTSVQVYLCKRYTHTHTHTHACTHAHTHTVQTDGSEGQCGLTDIFWEEKCLELTFEGRESSGVPDVLGEIVPNVGAKVWESAKAIISIISFFQTVWMPMSFTDKVLPCQTLDFIVVYNVHIQSAGD